MEVITKIFFRWGLDGSFMRFYYDYEDAASGQRLASTIFFFLAAVFNGFAGKDRRSLTRTQFFFLNNNLS